MTGQEVVELISEWLSTKGVSTWGPPLNDTTDKAEREAMARWMYLQMTDFSNWLSDVKNIKALV